MFKNSQHWRRHGCLGLDCYDRLLARFRHHRRLTGYSAENPLVR